MTTNTKTNTVYIVRFKLPVGIRLKGQKRLSAYRDVLTYQFHEKLRKKVEALRMHYRHLLKRYSISFYGLPLVREDDLPILQKWVAAADKEFRELHESLRVRCVTIPIDLSAGKKGEIYEAVNGAIKQHIYGEIFERLQHLSKKGKDLPENSRRALLKLVDRMKTWNLLGSKDISDKLEQMAQRFAVSATAPVEEELESQLKKLTAEGAWVEL
jgi:hypothetical protein